MAVGDLKLVKLHGPLIVFHGALILGHQFFLIIQHLLGNGIARPCGLKALKVHLCLCQHVHVPFEGSLRLRKSCHVQTIIDVRQPISLLDELTFLVVHPRDHPSYLAKDGCGIDRSHRPDRVQIVSDVPFLGRGRSSCDRRRWTHFALLLAAENQVKRKRKE
jgi:hypothetical protein